MQPGFFNHLLLISQFELKRSFATRRGILTLVTFAVVWCVILLYPLRFAAELLVQDKGLMQGFSFLTLLVLVRYSNGRFLNSAYFGILHCLFFRC